MGLIITIPFSYPAEREYIICIIFKEFLGLEYIIQKANTSFISISVKDNNSRLIIPDILFAFPEEEWLTQKTLPKQPLKIWNLQIQGIDPDIDLPSVPIIYGVPNSNIGSKKLVQSNQELRLNVDIFGSCFFMLTRYEEIVKCERDEHDRFLSKTSLSMQEGFTERAIVNEYVEILWVFLKLLLPGIIRKKREYRLLLSHDVDQIFSVVGKPLKRVIRRMAGDLLVRRDWILALESMLAAMQGCSKRDPCNTFDFLMNLSENIGVTSTFNFMSEFGNTMYDQRYSIDHPWVRHSIRRIAQRRHLIGYHPTYGSYLNPEKTKNEFTRLRMVAEEEGVDQDQWGGRQHYLRWKNPTTWQNWENAGLNYDSTIGFSDIAGFRAGCCYEYPVFDLKQRKQLNLRERPLIVMDAAVIYGNGTLKSEFTEKISFLSHTCKKFDGDFTLLWHNENVISKKQKETYRFAIESSI
jgi:hypothetical protein